MIIKVHARDLIRSKNYSAAATVGQGTDVLSLSLRADCDWIPRSLPQKGFVVVSHACLELGPLHDDLFVTREMEDPIFGFYKHVLDHHIYKMERNLPCFWPLLRYQLNHPQAGVRGVGLPDLEHRRPHLTEAEAIPHHVILQNFNLCMGIYFFLLKEGATVFKTLSKIFANR